LRIAGNIFSGFSLPFRYKKMAIDLMAMESETVKKKISG